MRVLRCVVRSRPTGPGVTFHYIRSRWRAAVAQSYKFGIVSVLRVDGLLGSGVSSTLRVAPVSYLA